MNVKEYHNRKYCYSRYLSRWITPVCVVITLLFFAVSLFADGSNSTIPKLLPGVETIDSSRLKPRFVSAASQDTGLNVHPQVPVLPPIQREDLARLIQDAQPLEAQSRWADAMMHYETAMRMHRFDPALMDRYRVARFHYDVSRRIHDTSYVNLMNHSGLDDTIAFFNEVMAKIDTDYADTPNWDDLFRHGITDIKIALTDAEFCRGAGLRASQEQIGRSLQDIQQTVDRWQFRNREDVKNGLFQVAEKLKTQLRFNPVTTIMEFTCGIINSLDVYSAYLTPRQLNDQFSMISGNLVGLGIELRSDAQSLLIIRVIPGSPAAESGLKDGDRILTVDGVSTQGRDTDSAADLLQGAEGTAAVLNIRSAGFGHQDRNVNVVRRQIEVPSVENVSMLNSKLGYARLTSFQTKTAAELNQAMQRLTQQGMKCLVLDLRGNPGGLFQVAIEVANMFLDKGAIVRTQGRDQSLDSPFMATAVNTWQLPLIVLIDEDSASAAEIVAGALRDHNRAVLVGKRTYGKGTVQQILPLRTVMNNGVRSGMKLTVEKFYSPKGWGYSGVGVSPNVVVADPKTAAEYTVAKPVNGQILRPITNRLDDPFIKEAVNVAVTLVH